MTLSNLTSASAGEASVSSGNRTDGTNPGMPPTSSTPATPTTTTVTVSSGQPLAVAVKRKRNLPGTPDSEAEVIALSPKTLMATNRFVCEICNKGFQRDQNLQLHRRGHNLPWKLRQRTSKEVRKRIYTFCCSDASECWRTARQVRVADAGKKLLAEEEYEMNTGCCSQPFDTSRVCADTSKGSELAGEDHVGRKGIVPDLTLIVNRLESMAAFPQLTQRVSMQALLKERFKDKLMAKLKPKLRLNYFKHRQESSSILPWVSKQEVARPSQNGEAAHIAHNAHIKQFSSDVASFKMLPAGVKIESDQWVLDVPSPFLSLGRAPSGQLVVRNLPNGRRKAGIKTSQLSRVNRFADSILQFVGEKSVPEKLIRGALGNNPDISKAIRLLLSEKRLKRLGDGGKGCAYVYVRSDLADPMAKTKELDPVHISSRALTIEREFVRELERRFPATNIRDSTVWNVLNGCGRMQGDRPQCDV